MRTFWENERPSSSDDETEIERCLAPEVELHAAVCPQKLTIENTQTGKDLDLSKNYLKSEIRMLEYKIKKYQTYLRNLVTTNRQLKTDNENAQKQKNELENELKSLKLAYNNDQTNFKNQELTNTQLITENGTLKLLINELENDLESIAQRFDELTNGELFFDTVFMIKSNQNVTYC